MGFRDFTQREAAKRRVRGYVRNLADGRVEVLAQGDAEDLEAFERRLREGPPAARVESVDRESRAADTTLGSFQVRY